MVLGLKTLSVVCILCVVSDYAAGNCGPLEPNFPQELQNRNFTGNQGYDWTFGVSLSPNYAYHFIYKVLGHTGPFVAEFYVKDFSYNKNTINYSCFKYEIVDSATVFVWVFETVKASYNDPEPDLCKICNGVVSRAHRLTDKASGLSISDEPPPELTEPMVPELCGPRR